MFSKAQLDHLQEGLKQTLTIYISRSKIERNGKALFFIAVDKPRYRDPKDQMKADEPNELTQRSIRLDNESIRFPKSSDEKEPNDCCDSFEEGDACAIEEHQPEVQNENAVRNEEHLFSNVITDTQMASKAVTAPRMCIDINNSRVERFASINLLTALNIGQIFRVGVVKTASYSLFLAREASRQQKIFEVTGTLYYSLQMKISRLNIKIVRVEQRKHMEWRRTA